MKKIDLEKWIESKRFMHRIKNMRVTRADFSCIFEKDLTVEQKKEISKHGYADDVDKALVMFLLSPSMAKKYGKIRKEIKVEMSDDGYNIKIKK